LLLCQGLIFQHEDVIQDQVILFFGVTAAIMIIGLVVFSIFDSIWRRFKGASTLCISHNTLRALDKALQNELLQLYSESLFDREGVIVLDKKSLNSLTPGQRQEVLGIISKEFELIGDEAFGKAAANYRERTQELDLFTAKG
jgi:hypothetical protein